MNIIGSKVSLISKSEIRYEGILYTIDTKESTVALQNVRSFGTEGRKKDGEQIPPSNEVYDYIIFRGSDIKDIRVSEGPQPVAAQPPRPNDPAIIAMPATQAPNMYGSYGQYPMNYQGYPNPNAFNPYGYTYFGSYPMQPQTQPPQQQPPVRGPSATQPASGVAPQPVAPQVTTQATPVPAQPQQSVAREEPKQMQSPAAVQPASQPTQTSQPAQQEQPAPIPAQNTQSDSEHFDDSRGHSERNYQGGNRGRRGGYNNGAPSRGGFQQNNNRGRRPPQGSRNPTKFTEDFDFETSNAKFDKDKISTEVEATITPYEPSSFFDSISCEATDRLKEGKDKQRASLSEQRKLDTETFGSTQTDRRYSHRGGRGRYNPHSHGQYSQNASSNTGAPKQQQQQQQQQPQQQNQRVFRPVNTGNERGGANRPRGRNPSNRPQSNNTQ